MKETITKKEKKMSKNLYLCIHAIQIVPACCINRDDTGTPKSMVYGRTRRARVSSQCWKREIRMYFKEHFEDTGLRTKHIVTMLANRLTKETGCSPDDASAFIRQIMAGAGIAAAEKKDKKKGNEAAELKEVSAFFSTQQVEAVYALIKDRFEKKAAGEEIVSDAAFRNKIIAAVKDTPAVSQLLFGRMFASNQSLNYDAACQIAHAFSVNKVSDETDYFTVVGDFSVDETSAGSDYIDSKLFNSGVLYRFANVNLSEGSELVSASGINAGEVAAHFIEAFTIAMPKGSINAYANMTVPEALVVEIRDDMPVSFAPAFAEAVTGDNICDEAVKKMYTYEENVNSFYGRPVRRWARDNGKNSLKEICLQVEEEINRRI